jgi:hypothetical protein
MQESDLPEVLWGGGGVLVFYNSRILPFTKWSGYKNN